MPFNFFRRREAQPAPQTEIQALQTQLDRENVHDLELNAHIREMYEEQIRSYPTHLLDEDLRILRQRLENQMPKQEVAHQLLVLRRELTITRLRNANEQDARFIREREQREREMREREAREYLIHTARQMALAGGAVLAVVAGGWYVIGTQAVVSAAVAVTGAVTGAGVVAYNRRNEDEE